LSTAAIERYALRSASTVGPAVVVAGVTTLLLTRLVPDVTGKPLHEDEAVAGLISARPIGDMLHTVVLDRGGAPLHFVLAHLALAFDSSPDALRWLSVVFALATVPLCYDLARRLSGRFAGMTAAALAATSQLLTVYGTFGRMYSLFAFTSALAATLFVRALERPERGTVLAAAAAALLPLAVHPFGAFLFAAEVAVALWQWQRRNIRAAPPVIGVALVALPLLLIDLRLSDRYAPEAGDELTGGYSAAESVLRALGGAAGGYGPVLALFAVLVGAGAFALGRRRPTFTAFACLAIAVPPIALAIAAATSGVSDRLGPRHLVFMLPLWIGLVATGASEVAARLPARARLAVPLVVVLASLLAPSAVADPRTIPTGEKDAVAAPAAWLRAQLAPGDMLYPYSPVFLASLPDAARAQAYSREPVALARAIKRTGTVRSVFVSLPLRERLSRSTLEELRGAGVEAHAFRSWLILRDAGSSRSGEDALFAAARMLRRARPVLAAPPYLEQLRGTACAALQRLGSAC
jgi:hypothetical protein